MLMVVSAITTQYLTARRVAVEAVGKNAVSEYLPLVFSRVKGWGSPTPSLTVGGWLATFVGSDHNSGYDHGPTLATDPYGNLWYVYSSSSGAVDGKDSIHIFCSSDGGGTWSYEGALYTLDSTWGIYEPSISVNPSNGKAYVGFTLGQKNGITHDYLSGTFVVLSFDAGSGCSLTNDTFVAVTPSSFAAKRGVVASDAGNNGYAYAVVMDTTGTLGFFSSSDYGASWTYVAYWNSGSAFTYYLDGTAKYGDPSGAYFAWIEIDDPDDPLTGNVGQYYVMYADWGPPGDTSSLTLWWFGASSGYGNDEGPISIAYLNSTYAMAFTRKPLTANSYMVVMDKGIDTTIWTITLFDSTAMVRYEAPDVALLPGRVLLSVAHDSTGSGTYRLEVLLSDSGTTLYWGTWPGSSLDATLYELNPFPGGLALRTSDVVILGGEPKVAYRKGIGATGGGDAWFLRPGLATDVSERGVAPAPRTGRIYDVLGRRVAPYDMRRGIYFIRTDRGFRKVIVR